MTLKQLLEEAMYELRGLQRWHQILLERHGPDHTKVMLKYADVWLAKNRVELIKQKIKARNEEA